MENPQHLPYGFRTLKQQRRLYRQKNIVLSTLFILLFFNSHAQVNTIEGKAVPKIKFSGYIKYEVMADTRQTVNAREGLVVLFPENILLDEDGNDVNSAGSLNMLSIHSKLISNITGPVLLGARSSGLVEADFFGNENKSFSDLNGLRLVCAYMMFDWGTTEFLAGQYWHPMSIREFFPGVISHGKGLPFHPMSRNPQIRVMQSMGRLKLIGCLLSQRDYTGTGPDGPDSKYLRDSGIPNIHFQLHWGTDSSTFFAGTGIDYKKIVPELSTTNDEGELFATETSLTGISFTGFVTVKSKHLSFRAQGIYAQNPYDTRMLGGYAVKRITNTQTGEKEFSNLNTVSVWGDVQTSGRKISFGLFGGYTKNMGAGEPVEGPFYARGADIGSLYRISPRIVYTNGPLRVSLECEYTTAYYGITNGDMQGGVTDTHPVSNFRSLLSLKYTF